MAGFDAAAIARLDRLYATPQVVEQRQRLKAALAPSPGELGLDVGCGAGHLTCDLVEDVLPDGRITGIDATADAVAAAKARAEKKGLAAAVTVQAGDATKLAFDDASFDFVVAAQVYCYVSNVQGALAEAHRVLREGGRMALLDSDWDFCTYRSADDGLTRRLIAARAKHQFAHAHLPRKVPALLEAVGLRLISTQVIALMETRYEPDSFGLGILSSLRQAGEKDGVPASTLEAWEKDLRSRTGPGAWFFCLNRFLFIAERA